jgi:hypothetical protein
VVEALGRPEPDRRVAQRRRPAATASASMASNHSRVAPTGFDDIGL